MTAPPEDPAASAPFSWEELAHLRAGLLSGGEQERLGMLMDHSPDRARQMLADLDAVEAEFPDPPNAHEPLQVPPHVAARWQSAIAREAQRRARGDTSSGPANPATTPCDHRAEGPG